MAKDLGMKDEVFSEWEHTSTAFGESRGCNFRIRLGAERRSGKDAIEWEENLFSSLQDETFRLSRLIDHRSLERDISFFATHPVTLENIALYLFTESRFENVKWVEVEGNDYTSPAAGDWRARVGEKMNSLSFRFSGRNARRVFDIEVNVTGEISFETGEILPREKLTAALLENFEIPEFFSNLSPGKDVIEKQFYTVKRALLPQKLSSVVLRDAIENRVVLRLSSDDTTLATSQSLHL